MDLPRVNPIGLVERPVDYVSTPRTYSRTWRVAAAIALGTFLVVGVGGTISSLGTYCLTTHAGIPVPF